MVSTKMLVAHLTVVLAVLICSIDLTTANLQCKNMVMKIIMEQCSSGFRGRRRRDLEEAQPKIENHPEIGSSQDHSPVKRQLGTDPSSAIAGMAAPIMEDMITGAISGARRGYRTQLAGGQLAGVPHGYPMAIAPVPRAFPGSPQYYVAAPPPPSALLFQPEPRLNKGFLPQESGDDLGFDLTTDEVDDLYDEISNRISRNSGKSTEEIRRDILQAAAKCCQNEELCRKEQSIIPCI